MINELKTKHLCRSLTLRYPKNWQQSLIFNYWLVFWHLLWCSTFNLKNVCVKLVGSYILHVLWWWVWNIVVLWRSFWSNCILCSGTKPMHYLLLYIFTIVDFSIKRLFSEVFRKTKICTYVQKFQGFLIHITTGVNLDQS